MPDKLDLFGGDPPTPPANTAPSLTKDSTKRPRKSRTLAKTTPSEPATPPQAATTMEEPGWISPPASEANVMIGLDAEAFGEESLFDPATWKDMPPPEFGTEQGARGFLFIGDPHLTSRTPARRLDEAIMFAILDKLGHAAAIARERRLIPVILGDLFDRPEEKSLWLLAETLTVLSNFPYQPYCLLGNHDLRDRSSLSNTAIGVLVASGVIAPVAGSGLVKNFHFDGISVAMGGTAYGYAIPDHITAPNAQKTIWITHHDLAFNGCYPGATPLFEIPGIDLVVNGHMHKRADSQLHGQTRWCNPGNITRLSLDCRDHEPAVWEWTPEMEEPVPHPLPHRQDVFDLTGTRVDAMDGESSINATQSLFADMLKEEGVNRQTSEDAGFLKEELEAVLGEQGLLNSPESALLNQLLQAIQEKETA